VGFNSLVRTLLRPIGFIGVGFFLAFVGLSWVFQQQSSETENPPPVLHPLSELRVVDGVVAGVSLPKDKRVRDAIALEVKHGAYTAGEFNVPDAILNHIGYLELKGKPITLRVDEQQTVFEVSSGGTLLYGYEDAARRHEAAVAKYESDRDHALAFSNRLRVYGGIVVLLGVAQFGLGILWWRRRGGP
jgi:hypothetical protein